MNSSPSERLETPSYSYGSNKLLSDRMGLEGEGRYYRGNSLSHSIKKSFGISHTDLKTISELNRLAKYSEIVNEMTVQRCFTVSYIADLLERHRKDKTISSVINILVKRKLLYIHEFVGKAKRTFALLVYYTHDATEQDLEDTLTLYTAQDEAWYKKEVQRKKTIKTPEQIVSHNKRVKELTKKDKVVVNDKCCDWKMRYSTYGQFEVHTCGKKEVFRRPS